MKATQGAQSIRVVVIGAGDMANRVHYPALVSLDGVEIAGVCDLDEVRLAETAHRWSIESTYTDYRAMIDCVQPDAVYAIGQPHLLFDVWTWCLKQGCNLYIEKPMGLTFHQAQVLTYMAEDSKAITQVSHQRRSSPLLRRVHEECLERGPITHAVVEFYKCSPDPMLAARDHMMDDGVHAIDTLRWMCGGEVVEVDSRCRRIGTPDINWIGATLYFDNGSIGYLINSWTSGRRVFRVEMHAPGIAVDAEVEGHAIVYADGNYEGHSYGAREVAGSNELFVYGGFLAKHQEFIDAVRSGEDSAGSRFADCLKTMEVAEMILARSLAR